jgi:hypothetical protein
MGKWNKFVFSVRHAISVLNTVAPKHSANKQRYVIKLG